MVRLNDETERLIERRMKETGASTPDELVQVALQTLHQVRGEDLEDMDADTQAALEEGIAQADRGETRSWEAVREEIRKRYIQR